jgi:hypothetical protein
MFNVTLAPTIVAVPGIPETFKVCVAPAAELSGIATLIAPELTVADPGIGGAEEPAVICVPETPAIPPQSGEAGVKDITGKPFTVSMAAAEVAVGAQVPDTIMR